MSTKKKKDPREGTLQFGLPDNIIFFLEGNVEEMRKKVPALRKVSDQSLLDLATISYKMGYDIAKTRALASFRQVLEQVGY